MSNDSREIAMVAISIFSKISFALERQKLKLPKAGAELTPGVIRKVKERQRDNNVSRHRSPKEDGQMKQIK